MKRLNLSMLPLFLILILSSCASNQVRLESDISNYNADITKKLQINDWKYKGFGSILPDWVEFSLKNDLDKVQSTDEILKQSTIEVFSGKGENSDQAEAAAKLAIEQAFSANPDYYNSFKLYDYFWVRTTEKVTLPYTSVYLYYKEQ